jgi:hypothetical protein
LSVAEGIIPMDIGTLYYDILIYHHAHRCRTPVNRAPSRAGTASLSATVWSCARAGTSPGMCRARRPSPTPSSGLAGRPCPWPRPGSPPNHVCNRAWRDDNVIIIIYTVCGMLLRCRGQRPSGGGEQRRPRLYPTFEASIGRYIGVWQCIRTHGKTAVVCADHYSSRWPGHGGVGIMTSREARDLTSPPPVPSSHVLIPPFSPPVSHATDTTEIPSHAIPPPPPSPVRTTYRVCVCVL